MGVARRYCGELGKSDCQVSLSVSTGNSSLPIARRLYLPELWCEDAERREIGEFRKRLRFKPNRRLLGSRFGKRWSSRLPREWSWQMRGTEKVLSSALSSPNWVCNTEWALSPTPRVWDPGQQPLPTLKRKSGRGTPQAPVAERRPSTPFGSGVGFRIAGFGLERDRLAPRE